MRRATSVAVANGAVRGARIRLIATIKPSKVAAHQGCRSAIGRGQELARHLGSKALRVLTSLKLNWIAGGDDSVDDITVVAPSNDASFDLVVNINRPPTAAEQAAVDSLRATIA